MNDDRTPEQAARAAPVSLPAGSYDSAELQKGLDEAAKAKNDDKRDELVAAAVEATRVVPDAPAADQAPADPAPVDPAPSSASSANKGE